MSGSRPRFLEEGDIFFCYRPRLDARRVRGLADVQRLFVVLKPRRKPVFRRVIIGRKRLPGLAEHERTLAIVDLVANRPDDIEDELDPLSYQTRTRSTRQRQAARPAGEGVYALIVHDGHTHLAYALELPEKPGAVQAELNITTRASLVIAVRNPELPPPREPGMPRPRRPDYPDTLQARFSGRRFANLDPPDFLDHPGAELVLIGAGAEIHRELGLSLDPRPETAESADVFTTLGMERDLHPLRPLLTGEWE
jgi:hypothetical protein